VVTTRTARSSAVFQSAVRIPSDGIHQTIVPTIPSDGILIVRQDLPLPFPSLQLFDRRADEATVTIIEQRRSDGGTNLSPLSVDPNKPVAKPLKQDE
jgi:hypothetical protein